MTFRVLITAPYFLPVVEEYRERLEVADVEIVTLPVAERLNECDLLPIIESIDGVVCGDDEFTRRVIQHARKLKVISKWGTGIDSIDTVAAAEFGIKVYNTPDAFTDAVADSTLGYILCFARRLVGMNNEMRDGAWRKPEAFALRGRTLGVVGIGNIGRAVIRRARAFGMHLLGNDPIAPPESFLVDSKLQMLPLNDLLEQSDFVTLHCDLNPTSFHLVAKTELQQMQSSAYLINTSRGPVIEEAVLVDALRQRWIAGAALDVFEVEPLPVDSPLRSMDNCLLAPHNANGDSVAHKRVHDSTIGNLLDGLRGDTQPTSAM